jgi:hypothetical protein
MSKIEAMQAELTRARQAFGKKLGEFFESGRPVQEDELREMLR